MDNPQNPNTSGTSKKKLKTWNMFNTTKEVDSASSSRQSSDLSQSSTQSGFASLEKGKKQPIPPEFKKTGKQISDKTGKLASKLQLYVKDPTRLENKGVTAKELSDAMAEYNRCLSKFIEYNVRSNMSRDPERFLEAYKTAAQNLKDLLVQVQVPNDVEGQQTIGISPKDNNCPIRSLLTAEHFRTGKWDTGWSKDRMEQEVTLARTHLVEQNLTKHNEFIGLGASEDDGQELIRYLCHNRNVLNPDTGIRTWIIKENGEVEPIDVKVGKGDGPNQLVMDMRAKHYSIIKYNPEAPKQLPSSDS
jgi:hypothetical protein